MDVSASPTHEDYLALKDYVVFNQTEGIIYLKYGKSVGKFSKFYTAKSWQSREKLLTYNEFCDMWPQICYMIQMNAIRTR